MIRLGKNYFQHFASSGALGYDGKGWPWEHPLEYFNLFKHELFIPITKTLTYKPNKGNFRWYKPWKTIKLLENGVINAMSLGNPGIIWWYSKYRYTKQIVSIYSENIVELASMIIMINNSNAIGIELNESCPNLCISPTEKIIEDCHTARKISNKPIILKLSILHDIVEILPKIDVDAISINSIPWNIIFPDNKPPLEYGGAVSGKIIQPYTWNFLQKIVKMSDIPVIGPSIWEYDDMHKLESLGAKGFSFGSIFLRYPWRPTEYVLRWEREKNFKKE